METNLVEWLEHNSIKYSEIADNIFDIEGIGIFLEVREKDIMIEEGMSLVLDEDEEDLDVDFYCFRFGDNYYYSDSIDIKNLNILKYIGSYKNNIGIDFSYLGVHGSFELLNGSRSYSDWVKKAKFLGINVLGIAEKNTLAGIIKFQQKCSENNIKAILGEQVVVKDGEDLYNVKLYVKSKEGWENLLLINTELNVINPGFIKRGRLFELVEGLVVVIDPVSIQFEKILPFQLHVSNEDLFWQLDSVQFEDDSKDREYLLNLKKFINEFKLDIQPVLICDSYYLDPEDSRSKILLNNISEKRDYRSSNQYFKPIDVVIGELSELFSDQDDMFSLIEKAVRNADLISSKCQFNIKMGQRLLPIYKMSEEDIEKYGDTENMFYSLIQDGADRKIPSGQESIYLNQIEEEIRVISGNGFVDYFLILWDIVKWAKSQDILVGIGRGSAGGCLIAYIMGITELDPIPYGLLFSRFLNDGRAKKSYPDIDTDFESSRRDDVKRYMENKYGHNQVCSIGTYTNMKLKQSLKDISKLEGIDFSVTNYISQILDIENGAWIDIFKTAIEKKPVKDFIHKYPGVIEDMRLILNQPKSKSIHACATIILPDSKDIFRWIPVRKEIKGGEEIIVSEWEGNELDSAGFLKEDILGVTQLDKYRFILNLIKKNRGESVDIYKIPLNSNGVYDLFSKGFNGDVFHFGSNGLTKYCKQLRPENINDLIAAISLYRPGAIENNFHNEYIFCKNGDKEVEYWIGAEKILNDTYGVIVYQEQVMKLCQVLGGLTLVEADDVRRSMVKKKYEELHKYKERFLNFYVENFNVSEDYALGVWDSIDKASSYLFNKSHAAAYAITGYIGQWLKYKYPLEYWTSAFQFDDPNPKKSKISKYISEIRKSDDSIKMRPPHINFSGEKFESSVDKMELYWSLAKVRGVGEVALRSIVEEREKNGEFFSFDEFINRIDKRVINKAIILNLILSGAFDDIENILVKEDRRLLIDRFYKIYSIKSDESNLIYNSTDSFFWDLKQKEITGFGEIDYKKLIRNKTDFKPKDFVDSYDLQDEGYINKTVLVAGLIVSFTERTSKKKNQYCNIELDSNNEVMNITLWSETFEKVKSSIAVGKILIMEGSCKFDSYRDCNTIQSSEESKIILL